VVNPGAAFSLTGANPSNSAVGTGLPAAGVCTYDFLAITGATDPISGIAADRFCGGALNPVAAGAAAPGVQVCSKLDAIIICL
jgi:hypothetical protein